jgi:hypothetical protein
MLILRMHPRRKNGNPEGVVRIPVRHFNAVCAWLLGWRKAGQQDDLVLRFKLG